MGQEAQLESAQARIQRPAKTKENQKEMPQTTNQIALLKDSNTTQKLYQQHEIVLYYRLKEIRFWIESSLIKSFIYFYRLKDIYYNYYLKNKLKKQQMLLVIRKQNKWNIKANSSWEASVLGCCDSVTVSFLTVFFLEINIHRFLKLYFNLKVNIFYSSKTIL